MTSPSRNWHKAFSLVEVAMALGVVAFAFMALLGALPVALKTYRGAMELTLRTAIARQVVASIEQSWQAGMVEADFRTDWFDDQGCLVPSAQDAVFRVETRAGQIVDGMLPVVVEIYDARNGVRTASVPVVVPRVFP